MNIQAFISERASWEMFTLKRKECYILEYEEFYDFLKNDPSQKEIYSTYIFGWVMIYTVVIFTIWPVHASFHNFLLNKME